MDSKYIKIQIAVLVGNAKVLYSQSLHLSLTNNQFWHLLSPTK
jgi:hypothetical protein